jgi:hypothetical protein
MAVPAATVWLLLGCETLLGEKTAMMGLIHGFLLLFFALSIAPVLILFEMRLSSAQAEPEPEPREALRTVVGQAAWLQEVPTYARQAAIPHFRRGGF